MLHIKSCQQPTCCATMPFSALEIPGNKLAEILRQTGSFEAMELKVKMLVSEEETNKDPWGLAYNHQSAGIGLDRVLSLPLG